MQYELTAHEKQSNTSRVKFAEGLIRQLPATHDGRNTWLLNYGTSEEAVDLRLKRGIPFMDHTQSAAMAGKVGQ